MYHKSHLWITWRVFHGWRMGDDPHLKRPHLLLQFMTRQEDVSTEVGSAIGSASVARNRPEDIIRAREEEFFRELASDGHPNSHPLQHMIASQHKLKSIGVPRVHVDPHAAAKKSRLDARTSPYAQPQVFVEYIAHAKAHCHNSKALRLTPREHHAIRRDDTDHVRHGLSSSATKHCQFLSETLGAVQEQLESTALDESFERISDAENKQSTGAAGESKPAR